MPHGGNILIYFYTDFGKKYNLSRLLNRTRTVYFFKTTVHLIEHVQCICLDLCIHNILRNTEETSNKHHTTSTYVEPPREEKRKAKKHVPERHKN